MNRFVRTFLTLVLFAGHSFAQIDTINLFARSGDLTLFDGTVVHHRIYTQSAVLERNSDILILDQGQTVFFRLINSSAEPHGFKIDGLFEIPVTLPGDTSGIEVTLTNEGVFRYYDTDNTYNNTYLGLSGVLHVKSATDPLSYFYWDLREFETSWNTTLNSGSSVNPLTYDPEFFLINGNSSPDIDSDPLAKLNGSVGQDLRIIIVNNGKSIHSMHFHGYHSTVITDTRNSSHVGRLKDTFPVYPDEITVLSLVPDKPGQFPVHDHNLVAVTGGGEYHAGMFTIVTITP